MKRMKKSLAVIGVAALMAPATAFGAESSGDGYGGPGNIVSGLEEGGGDNPGGNGGNGGEEQPVTKAGNEGGGNLPFTGADLGVLAAAGGTLLGLGFGLRRLTHRPTRA
jgi:hypothetical protein